VNGVDGGYARVTGQGPCSKVSSILASCAVVWMGSKGRMTLALALGGCCASKLT
jgi:hypothetical protein